MIKNYIQGLLLFITLCLGITLAADSTSAELELIKTFLDTHFTQKGLTWNRGPEKITAEAVAKAYEGLSFYYIFSAKYPVASGAEVSRDLKIDANGNITAQRPFKGTDSTRLLYFNDSLITVTNKNTARLAGAAIMCLIQTHFGPKVVPSKQVQVTSTENGWLTKTALDHTRPGSKRKPPQHIYRVSFNKQGKCISTRYNYTGELPVCLGGLVLPIQYAEGISSPCDQGAVVLVSLEPGSVAEKSGLQAGDIIYKFDGRILPPDQSIEWLRERMVPLKLKGNESRIITVFRDQAELDIKVTWP
jgi:hypothetical protein